MKTDGFAVEILNSLPGMAYRRLNNPPNYTFTFVSEGCFDLFGYAPEELMGDTGINLMTLIHPEDAHHMRKLYGDTLEKGIPLETSYRAVTRNGETKRVWVRSRVIDTDDAGVPLTVEGFCIDVTKFMRLETQRLANRSKTDFLSKLSMEIRTPMNIIMGMADIALQDDAGGKMHKHAQTIKTAGNKLISVLDDISDYAKLESGQLEIKQDVYSFSKFLREIVTATTEKAAMANLEFLVNVDSNIPEILVGDREHLYQILANILDNAVKFTDAGFISLTMEGVIEGQTLNLDISVADTGRGIKDGDLSRVLWDFSQFDEKVVAGIGLGLPNADKLAKLMGGEIKASSVYGVGSIFNVTLPQQIFSHGSICNIGNPHIKTAIVFENRDDYRETLINILEDFNVPYEVTDCEGRFCDALLGDEFAFAFVASMIFDEIKVSSPYVLSQRRVQLVLIQGRGEKACNYEALQVLPAPVFCLPVADILNGVYFAAESDIAIGKRANVVKFTAPNAHVLAVDDISANLAVIEGLLAPYRINLDLVESGAAAIDAVKIKQYDMILMDCVMPVMDGTETTLAIRALENAATNCEEVPIVALTARIDGNKQTVLRTGIFDDLIPKPIDTNKLNEVMEKWIPAELQMEAEAKKAPQSPGGSPLTPFIKIEGVDVAKGIKLAGGGNFDTYIRVLEKFCENGRRLLEEIPDAVQREDFSLCAVYMHALRSISASIGANLLSQTARVLETASEQGQAEFIKAKTPKFLEDLEAVIMEAEYAATRNRMAGNNEEATLKARMSDMDDTKKKILLIDDTETFLFLLNDILKEDYETFISKDGEDGLETAQFAMPDLILLDIVMPGMNGFDVMEALKADDRTKHIPVVLVSGKDTDEDKAKGYDAGAVGYIQKPFKPDEVKSEVEKAFAL
ncbi:MAG: response regulator [Defluviitaleaceae bacterium]|nr:response regulator [Defluviitaleaceae bacterium]